jgi:hypothetical protein
MKNFWNEEYYDIINYYLQEPQRIGKKTNKDSRYAKTVDALARVKGMEQSLNHIFNIFFSLLPDSVLNEIIKNITKSFDSSESLAYQSQKGVDALNLGDMTQPDVFFVGEKSLVGIEMKINAKCSVEQVIKYACLFHFASLQNTKLNNFHLVLVGPSTFQKLFSPTFQNNTELQKTITLEQIPAESKKGKINLDPHKPKILKLIKNMSIDFINYSDFSEKLNSIVENIDKSSDYSQTIFKLINGVNEELLSRNLTKIGP